ncbi:helix-turn-helix domain-containing protein [Streptomyces californicus]|uniref:helix-turn-helix domain-containing protein n=1 Tax=Streptomyces californicus TaxID=67351 RepID=UPI0004C0CD16|nr:helix-turn-helix transcriptional regulator [Streptomyces californicus]
MTTAPPDTEVGPLLREWRERRRISQLELALRADSSARHISFVETGRSRPSEGMVLRLAEALDVPVRERNALLVMAGYAPRYAQTPLDAPAMSALRESLDRLLTAYEPYPALVVDGVYGVVAANRGIALLLEGVAERLLVPPVNAMRLTLHPEGLAPRIVNLPEWRADLLAQMERQIALVRSPALRELYEEVAAYPVPERPADTDRTDVREGPGGPGGSASAEGRAGGERAAAFALPMRLEHGGRVLSFVSSIATFNTPMDVTVAELAIETFLPADRETAAYLHAHLPP